MHLTRRTILAGMGSACALPFGSALAATEMTLGDTVVMTLSDGSLTLPSEFIFAPTPPDVADRVKDTFGLSADTLTPPCNVTLMRRGSDVVLFDCGAGPAFQPTAGALPAALDAAGLDAAEITHIVFTHGHPDHLWGLLDDFDEAAFPEARLLMGAAELDYWRDPTTPDTIGEARAAFAAGAARRIDALSDRWETFGNGDEVVGGVTAVSTPGHTPGHMSFVIADGEETVLVVGDALSNHHMAFAAPDVVIGADQDMQMAADTRLSLLSQATADRMTIIGFHLPDGGIGRVEANGAAYRFLAM